MMTLIAAALVAAGPPAPAPQGQMAPMQQHEGKKDCCKDCCKDMAKEGHEHSADHAAHTPAT